MLAKTGSIALVGTDAYLVDVEVSIGDGVPGFTIVGLPAKSVKEAEQRTRSAIEASNERWPKRRVVANLAPGALRKEGTQFDLAIALGILAAAERVDPSLLDKCVAVGELALDGHIRPVRGVLAAAIACRKAGVTRLLCPAGNAPEAALVEGVEVVPLETLRQCVLHLRGAWLPPRVDPAPPQTEAELGCMSEVRGHCAAKDALEVAAAGGHNVLLKGPPGSGKTMLARRLPGILPEMSLDESLDVTLVRSVAGLLQEGASLVTQRPFRMPHHHISLAGLVGGGSGLPRPGEISLAHHGVLFLDELTLFRQEVLEALRTPLEEGVVRIARSGGAVSFPCRFSLIAAMNPCPCGYAGDRRRRCSCSELQLRSYNGRISGPLLDRFDMQVALGRLTKRELLGRPEGDRSADVRERVQRARIIQNERYGSPQATNASVDRKVLNTNLRLTPDAREVLEALLDGSSLTGRGLDRVLRVARTIADLEAAEETGVEHVARAENLRLVDRHEEAS